MVCGTGSLNAWCAQQKTGISESGVRRRTKICSWHTGASHVHLYTIPALYLLSGMIGRYVT